MLRSVLIGLLAAAAASAQSPLTTTFAYDNGGAPGGGIYFDLTVSVPQVTVNALDLNVTGTGSIEVYTIPGTRLGNQLNPALWTLVSTGAVTGGVAGVPTPVAITPFTLPSGSWGVALKAIGVSHNNTNGTGANQNYSTTELALAAGEANNTAFSAALFSPRVVNCSIAYSVGSTGTVVATNTSIGAGCVRQFASVYENFAASAGFDLANSVVSFLPTATGYVMIPGGGAFIPVGTTGTPTNVAIGDDVEQTVPFTVGSFPGWTGVTVCSNGFVSKASGNGTAFASAVAAFLAGSQDWFSLGWHDFNPAIAGSGQIKLEESAAVTVITWDGVYDFGGSAANTSTMQIQLYATGIVTMAWGVMSAAGNGYLTGYSPGGPNQDPGNTDLSSVLALGSLTLSSPDVLPLAVAATSRPVTGTNWNLNVSNVPATGVIGVDIFGLADPGIPDLASLGLPGCGLRASLDILNAWFVAGPSHAQSFPVPNNPALVNLHLFTTSAVFQPGVNGFGAITANGIDGKVGDF